MAQTSLTKRVEILEQQVETLKELPARMTAVEEQMLQLRAETRDGFSALGELRLEMRAMHHELLVRFGAQDEKFKDLKRHMHMLHEDALDRIARLGER
jgi:hypothetical protein